MTHSERELIEHALEEEPRTARRQTLLKRLWKLDHDGLPGIEDERRGGTATSQLPRETGSDGPQVHVAPHAHWGSPSAADPHAKSGGQAV